MTQRWATIITNNDGKEEVSTIAQMEGSPPEVRTGSAKVEKVVDGVLIGMIRGGPVDAVGGFGFPEGSPGAQGRGGAAARSTDKTAGSAKDAKAKSAKAKSAADSEGKADDGKVDA